MYIRLTKCITKNNKLAHYGISGTVLQWIQNYLAERKQTVIFKKYVVYHKDQLLFLIYINDVSAVSQVTFAIMFTDDTHFLIQGGNLKKIKQLFKHSIE